MPAILRPDDYDLWLDPGIIDPARAANMLTPFDAQLIFAITLLVLLDE